MTLNDIEKIYFIQEEEFQLGEKSVYVPEFFINYKVAKKRFKEIVNERKNKLDYLESEIEGVDFVMLTGTDEWGETRIEIWLRDNELNKEQIK